MGRKAEEQGGRGELETQNSKPTYGFAVASYDKTKDLIIDPLLASTYLGGAGDDSLEYGNSLSIDAGGNVYVMGNTNSSDFPTTLGAYDASFNGGNDVFVSRFNSSLTTLLASTYLGGTGDDRLSEHGNSLSIDAGGNVYVTGETSSSDFPTPPGAYDTSFNGVADVFVSRFNSGLTSLLASTFFGGTGGDYGFSLSIDAGGNVYVTGVAGSSDFPATPGAYDTSWNGSWDVFVSRFNSTLTSLLASTFLGGTSADRGYSLSIDAGGNVYVTGYTYSSDFPTPPGAYDTSYNGDRDVFVSRFNSGLTSLLASTFLGGSGYDEGYSLSIDAGGNVYVTGRTYSSNFPTPLGAYDTSHNGGADVFVSKLDGNLSDACDGKVKTVETDTGDFELLKLASKVVTVTVSDGGGCPVADVKVSAKIKGAGKKRIGGSPSSKTTDENGNAVFTITAKEKTGKAKVTFKAGGVTEQITVTVVR